MGIGEERIREGVSVGVKGKGWKMGQKERGGSQGNGEGKR